MYTYHIIIRYFIYILLYISKYISYYIKYIIRVARIIINIYFRTNNIFTRHKTKHTLSKCQYNIRTSYYFYLLFFLLIFFRNFLNLCLFIFFFLFFKTEPNVRTCCRRCDTCFCCVILSRNNL